RRQIRRPLPLTIQALEQTRRRPADRNNVATDFLQLHGQRFSLFKTSQKTFPLLAAKADKRRNDLNAFRRMFVPVSERLAAMGRLDQTNAGAPCNHSGTLQPERRNLFCPRYNGPRFDFDKHVWQVYSHSSK